MSAQGGPIPIRLATGSTPPHSPTRGPTGFALPPHLTLAAARTPHPAAGAHPAWAAAYLGSPSKQGARFSAWSIS